MCLLFWSVLLAPIAAQESDRLVLYYSLQNVRLGADERNVLDGVARERAGKSYFVIQGFACDTGGYTVSHRIAAQRGSRIATMLEESNIPREQILLAPPIVLLGEPQTLHRRIEVRSFEDQSEAESVLAEAKKRASILNRRARVTWDLEEHDDQADPDLNPDERSNHSDFVLALVFIAILFVLALAYLAWQRYRGMQRERKLAAHQFSEEEAAAISVMTGGEVQPIARKPRKREYTAPRRRTPIKEFIEKAERGTVMAARKKKTSSISIRGAVERTFEDKSLNELCKSPVNALEGLTPRHARLLEEAFGIKTVEDLASLKYVELARAIVILSEYEK